MDDDIVWEEPAPIRNESQATKWRRFAARLHEHPGRWAVAAADVSQSTTGSLKRQLTYHGLEATSRQTTEGRARVYARWPEEP